MAAPLVTGIGPMRGTPGMKLTIRGENFGTRLEDVQYVFIGGIDVGLSLNWASSAKITVITPLGFGELEIVVVVNGKLGTSTVKYIQMPSRIVGAQEQVTFWPEEERKNCQAVINSGRDAQQSSCSDLIDSKTGLPTSELPYLTKSQVSDQVMEEIYSKSGASFYLTDSDFDPMVFALKYYKNCSVDELKRSMMAFQKCEKVNQQAGGEPVELIKANLMPIFECLQQMDLLRLSFNDEDVKTNKREARIEEKFQQSLRESIACGNQLFSNVLARRQYAESARSCLLIVQRFQFLFCLPEKITQNIARRQYSQAIHDFTRARALFQNTEVDAFKKIYEDVQNKIDQFKEELRQKLVKMPIKFEEAKSIVGYLTELEVDYDPAWMCLTSYKQWLIESLNDSLHLFKTNVVTTTPAVGSTTDPVAIRQRSSTFHASSVTAATFSVSQLMLKSAAGVDEATVQRFVETICQLMSTDMVQFWRLGNAYVSKQLPAGKKFTHHHQHIKRPALFSQTSRRHSGMDLDPADTALLTTPQNIPYAWSLMNQEVIQTLGNHFRSTVQDLTNLGSCIREFRKCFSSLSTGDLPRETRDQLIRLSFDLRKQALQQIFKSTQLRIVSMAELETWRVDICDELGAVTQLPAMYEAAMSDALTRCRNLVHPQSDLERPMFDYEEIEEHFPNWCIEAMSAIAAAFGSLAEQIMTTVLRLNQGKCKSATLVSKDQHTLVQAKSLLVLLNNCDRTLSMNNVRLLSLYEMFEYCSYRQLVPELDNHWLTHQQSIIEHYTEVRASWLFETTALVLGRFHENHVRCLMDEHTCQSLVDIVSVAEYMHVLANNLSRIQAELCLLLGTDAYSSLRQEVVDSLVQKRPRLLSLFTRVLKRTVELLLAEMRERMHFESWHRMALLQVTLDFNFLRMVLGLELVKDQRALFQSFSINSCDKQSAMSPEEQTYLQEILKREIVRCQLLVASFQAILDTAPSEQSSLSKVGLRQRR